MHYPLVQLKYPSYLFCVLSASKQINHFHTHIHLIFPFLSSCVIRNLNRHTVKRFLLFKLFRKYLEVDKNNEDEMEWQNLFDKRTRCLFLLNGVNSYSETFRSKILTVKDINLLESIRLSFGNISCMYRNYSEQYSKTKVVDYVHSSMDINPNLIKQRQMEIHSICCEIQVFCKEVKPHIKSTLINNAIRQFFNIMHSICKFFERTVMDNPIFHVVDPNPPSRRKCSKFY